MAQQNYDLIVIGAGVGGYVASIRAAQLGMKVACIDKRGKAGGTCLNVGCIPSKALLHSSHKYVEAQQHLAEHGIQITGDITLNLKVLMGRKNKIVDELTKGVAYLFKKNNITFIAGAAHFETATQVKVVSPEVEAQILIAPKILIATGSTVIDLPGIMVDEQQIVSSTGALSLSSIPEKMIIIGGGYIGLELGSVWQRLGSQVTIIERMDKIVPTMDQELAASLMKALSNQGIIFRLATNVISVDKTPSGLKVAIESADGALQETLESDVVLSCAGRRPYTDNLGLDKIGLTADTKGRIAVNEYYETAVPGIYAVGDVIQGPMLAHKAEEEAMAVAEFMAGQQPHVNYNVIPAVVYTSPEVAQVGKTEQELQAAQHLYKVGKFPFSANSRAKPNGQTDGYVKILADTSTDEVLGVHIIHADAGTLIAEAALAMEFRASSEDIARTCHAHPTLNEALKEAALNVANRAIHI